MSSVAKSGVPALEEELLSSDRRLYECAVLYPLLSPQEEKELLKNIEALFGESGGEKGDSDAWGRRGLAYPIKGMREGNFIIYHYHLDPAHVREIDRQLRILPGVLRHLLITLPEGHTMVRYSQMFESWKEEQKTHAAEERSNKEEKLKKRVIDRVSKRIIAEKPKSPPGVLTEAALKEGIEKIISDEDINL